MNDRLRRMTSAATCVLLSLVLIVMLGEPARADGIRDQEWIVKALQLDRAHRYGTGSGVVVAEIDSGVDATHPDLVGNILSGIDITPGSSHGPGNIDIYGHGTAVASLIAGHGHGSDGMAGILGVAPQATILPIRNGNGFGTLIPEAIDWAINHHARVICIAEGNPFEDPETAAAVQRAEDSDIVIVAGAGNGTNLTSIYYPAAYPGVVAVAGTDEKGNHAAISATGPEVLLAAPATNLIQDYLHHGYAEGTGTSASTAIVAGAAALVRARLPKLSATEVIHRLTATAIDKGPPGRDPEYGYGLINIVGALTADVPPLQPSTSPTPTPAPSVTVSAAPSSAIARPTNSSNASVIALVAAAVALFAVVGAWITARRRVPR